tara:strand:+ start:1237 stop:1542 length:306 start_codon:yes stop_codon:yes gene_type:complete
MLLFFRPRIRIVEPNTRDKLATLEPITFPTTIGPLFSKAAKKEVEISGKDVPKAITIEPIRKGEIPNFLEEIMAYFSSLSALNTIRRVPKEMTEKAKNIAV